MLRKLEQCFVEIVILRARAHNSNVIVWVKTEPGYNVVVTIGSGVDCPGVDPVAEVPSVVSSGDGGVVGGCPDPVGLEEKTGAVVTADEVEVTGGCSVVGP